MANLNEPLEYEIIEAQLAHLEQILPLFEAYRLFYEMPPIPSAPIPILPDASATSRPRPFMNPSARSAIKNFITIA